MFLSRENRSQKTHRLRQIRVLDLMVAGRAVDRAEGLAAGLTDHAFLEVARKDVLDPHEARALAKIVLIPRQANPLRLKVCR